MFQGEVLVAGSANIDHIMRIDGIAPADDASYNVVERFQGLGGHGANTALAARRYGAKCGLLSTVGDDSEGRNLLDALQVAGVDIGGVSIEKGCRTGQVLIPVFNRGLKFMLFDTAIRSRFSAASCVRSKRVAGGVLVIMDIPPNARRELIEWAVVADWTIVLALCGSMQASARELSGCRTAVVVVGNQAEMDAFYVNADHAGHLRTITTRGRHGCLVHVGNERKFFAGVPVATVDTVGAGDCFAGVLAACLASRLSLAQSACRANFAAALSTTGSGAQTALPSAEDVDELEGKKGDA